MIKCIYWLIFRKKVVEGGLVPTEDIIKLRDAAFELSMATGVSTEECSKIIKDAQGGFKSKDNTTTPPEFKKRHDRPEIDD